MGSLNLNMVVNDYLGSPSYVELRRAYPQVRLELELEGELPSVLGSPVHLSKVLMNLVTNAFEAMPDGGTLSVRTYCTQLQGPMAGYESIEPGRYVVLAVKDTGTGIEAEDVGRIFEPFYTKKQLGRSGSGLGLAVVYGVAHDHKARIDLQTEVGEGSEFRLYFPLASQDALRAEPIERDYRGTEAVLVVDDVPEQREVATRLLSSLGYRVQAVDSGHAALEILERQRVDLLVLDMLMGNGMDGLDTFRESRKLYSGQKAVIASGFSETERVREAQELGVGQFVRKPYTLDSLGKAVRSELDR
jgi:CheY-like chemotaxis protein